MTSSVLDEIVELLQSTLPRNRLPCPHGTIYLEIFRFPRYNGIVRFTVFHHFFSSRFTMNVDEDGKTVTFVRFDHILDNTTAREMMTCPVTPVIIAASGFSVFAKPHHAYDRKNVLSFATMMEGYWEVK